MSWVAPADDGGSALTGYDVHYTASATVDGDAEAGTDAATDWVAITRTEASPPAVTQAVTGLDNGTSYWVRVRAKNALGSSAWLHHSVGFGPTTATRPRLTGLTLAAGSTAAALTPAFAGAKTNYTATVPHDAASVTVTATWTAPEVGVKAGSLRPDGEVPFTNPITISSSGGSATVDLASSGETWVKVALCKQNDCTNYRIDVTRAPEPPSAPRNVQATPGNGKLTLAWGAPHTWGAAPADRFEVQWKLSSAGASAWSAVAAGGQSADIGATGTGFEFTGAQTDGSGNAHTVANGTGYNLRIRAVSLQSGNSLESDWVTASGTPAAPTVAPPTVPQSVAVTPGDGKLTLTWAAPSSWGDWTADGFVAQWKLSSDDDTGWHAVGNGTGSTIDLLESTDTSFVFSGEQITPDPAFHTVANGTAYDLRIRAVSSSSGSNLRSPWVAVFDSVPTALPVPGAVTDLSVTAGDEKLDLSWTAPSGTVTGYDVHYTAADAADVDPNAPAGTDAATGWKAADRGTEADPPAASQTISGLDNGTTYRLRVRAKNGSGDGPWVFSGVSVTPVAPPAPGAVTDLNVTAGDTVLNINWTAPSETLTGYEVHYTSAPATGSNAVANNAAAGADAATGWKAVDRGTEADPPAASQAISGLDNGTAYRVRVRAKNGSSAGRWKFATGTPVAPAGAVTGLTVTAEDAQLDLSWTAPSGTVTGYEVHYTSAPATGAGSVPNDAAAGADAATGWKAVDRGTEADPPAASQSISGLTNGTAYRLRVRAANAGGDGPWEFGTGTPAAPPAPGAVTGLTVSASDTSLSLEWTAPSETLTGYEVHYTSASTDDVANGAAAGTDAATGWKAASRTEPDPPLAAHFLAGLTNGTAYRVRVRAKNGSSPGPWEFGTGTPSATAAVVAPSVPRNVQAAPGDGKLTLTWAAPSSWNSWPAANYEVGWKESDGTDWWGVTVGNALGHADLATSVTSHEFTGQQELADGTTVTVANGTAYDLRIRAVSQQSGTDGSEDGHFRYSDWVTVSNKVPMAQPDRGPAVASTASQTLWSATLTVGDGPVVNGQPAHRGCSTGTCTPNLTDDDFTFDGTDHEVTLVVLDNAGGLAFKVNKSLAGKKRRLVLHVGGVPFYGRDATFQTSTPANSRLDWTNTGLTWSTGDTVALSLVELPTVQLSVTPNPVTEGERVSVTASLLRGSGSSRAVAHIPGGVVKVPVIVTAGTAEARFDYGEGAPRADGTRRYLVSVNGTHRVNFGTVNFNTHKDGDRDDETFTVSVDTASLSPSLVAGDASSVTVTIEDLDEPVDSRPMVKLSVNPDRVREGGPVGVSVLMSSGLAADVTIPVTVTRGTSEERDHGTLEHGGASGDGVLIPAGTCCRTALVYTHVDGDTDDETFTVALDEASLPASVRLDPDGPAEVEVTIVDDGRPGIVTERSVTATEGQDDNAVFTVRLGGAVAGTVSVDYATADTTASWTGSDGPATAGADYTATSGTLTFAPGETAKTVSVPILDDAADEGTEHFLLRFSNPRGAVLSAAFRETVGLIENDDHLQAMWLARFGAHGGEPGDRGGLRPARRGSRAGGAGDARRSAPRPLAGR